MKVLVLGGTGKVGRHVVALALARGWRVTMVARASTPAEVPSGVRLLRAELTDEALLDEAMRGTDAVLCSIGMVRANPANPWSRSLSPPDLMASVATQVTTAMLRASTRRIVAVSAAGVGDSASELNLAMRFFLATTMIGAAYEDLAKMESVLARSGLDWLAPRPTRLTDDPSRPTTVSRRFGMRDAIPRVDVARWMVDALTLPHWPAAAWGSRTPQITSA